MTRGHRRHSPMLVGATSTRLPVASALTLRCTWTLERLLCLVVRFRASLVRFAFATEGGVCASFRRLALSDSDPSVS